MTSHRIVSWIWLIGIVIPFGVAFVEARPSVQILVMAAFLLHAVLHYKNIPLAQTMRLILIPVMTLVAIAAVTYWVLVAIAPVCNSAGMCGPSPIHGKFAMMSGIFSGGMAALLTGLCPTRWPRVAGVLPSLVDGGAVACLVVVVGWNILRIAS